ncbi:hypothetical protein ElyMa_003897300 [Elysia marginata]|uniref:Reverse transcriptase/retrotransposon-derived protein RNase H-like domain-containing protein n=1 Tax=Elysia marginata TaxID=1093978 RepID=A0AAV4FNM1_9GAST|nr:hypothetical protein ElyMa_003897300 [Elysia marginata]
MLPEVKKAGTLFAAFLVEHNLLLAIVDRAVPLLKEMFPDSPTAKENKCRPTKTRQIVSSLASEAKEKTVGMVQNRPFSLSTDASNNKGSEQLYPIILRYHNGTEVVTEVLNITTDYPFRQLH